MKKVEDLTKAEKDLIAEKIDSEFTRLFLDPRRAKVEAFLEAVFVNGKGIKLKEGAEATIFDLIYYANCPLSTFRLSPNYEFISSDLILEEATLELPYFPYDDVHEIVESIVQGQNLDYTYMMDGDYFDPAFLWENQSDLEMDFYRSCWASIKPDLAPNLKCFLCANDGSGDYVDLDNGAQINLYKEFGLQTYLDPDFPVPKADLSIEVPIEKRPWWQLFKK